MSDAGMPTWARWIHRNRGLIVPIGFVLLLGVLLVPLPPVLMDALIAFNVSLAVIVLLTTVYMDRPLDFSVFPSLLLATTLLRLVLNIASTRLILTADAASPDEAIGVAGKVISAFGNFVAGDSVFVGVIIFAILVLVQFLVITKGATRISEVAARFTLDAMPGKQMAIDSDLSAGIVSEGEARERREEIRREADFFGAMDGASKFVRGDAIAGIIITIINILGGFAVGAIERGWPAGQTAEVFTKLTIGDGIASQIPSLVISIAAALIVTRSGSKAELGEELTGQLTSQPRGLLITAGFLAALALTPLPTVPLIATSIGLSVLAFTMRRAAKTREQEAEQQAKAEAVKEQASTEAAPVESLLKVDTMELEVGYQLVGLVDQAQGGDLLDRISAVRRQLAVEIGLVMPPVRIRDNMQLDPCAYKVRIRGAEVAQGLVRPGKVLAMDSGIASGELQGEAVREPAFGLDAIWVEPKMQGRAESMNYTVVGPTSVLATHLTEVVRSHADELLTRAEVNNLLEQLKERDAKLVEDTIGPIVKIGELQKVLQALLRERAPIRDMETIVATLGDWGDKTKDIDVLTEYARHALRRVITQQHATPNDRGGVTLHCVTLDPSFEDQISAYIDRNAAGTVFSIPARVAERLTNQIASGLERLTAAGRQPVILASPQTRAQVRQMIEPRFPMATVLGYNEVVAGIELESAAMIAPPPESEAPAA
ncbi:MAG: flagellar biosynthesis protein FlhA [Planctomycetota bacterium]